MQSFFREHRLLRFSGPEDERDAREAAPSSAPTQVETEKVDSANPTEGAKTIADTKIGAANAFVAGQEGALANQQANIARLQQQLAQESGTDGSASGAGGATAV